MSSDANFDRIEYDSVNELLDELKSCLKVPGNLEKASDYLFNSLVDEVALGIAFELHHNAKTGKYSRVEGNRLKSRDLTLLGCYLLQVSPPPWREK